MERNIVWSKHDKRDVALKEKGTTVEYRNYYLICIYY